MSVRVYTFERDHASEVLGPAACVSSAAAAALTAAINERPIRFEQLTEPGNPHPVMAVLFADPICMQHFDGLIDATLKLSGVRALSMRELDAHEPMGLSRLAGARPANDNGPVDSRVA